MKKVFFEDLPRKIYHSKECIDWKGSVGYNIKFVYDEIKGFIKIINYNKGKITISYENKTYEILYGNLKNGQLGKILNKYTENFKYDIGETVLNNDITIIDKKYKTRINNKNGNKITEKWYKYKCNKCGFNCGKHYNIKNKKCIDELWINESHLFEGNGCACCSNRIIVKGINDIATTNPELVKYFVNIEDAYNHSKSSSDKSWIKCPDCCFKKYITIGTLYAYGFSCPICGDGISYPEKVMGNVLKKIKVDFTTQLSKSIFNWCEKYRYDFYFEHNNKKYIIETHGSQHYKESGFKMSLEEVQENDKIKKELALKNNIKEENYIVIDCRKSELEFIKNNIIHSKLNNIFDLNNIDWIKIGQDSEKSLVKEVCDYWNMHNNISNKKTIVYNLCKNIHLTKSTVTKYLKRGESLGWI